MYRNQGDPLVLEVNIQQLSDGLFYAYLMQPLMFPVGQQWITGSSSFLAHGHGREYEEEALMDLLWEVHNKVNAKRTDATIQIAHHQVSRYNQLDSTTASNFTMMVNASS